MRRRYVAVLSYGLIAAALATLPLTGCTTAFITGESNFGGTPGKVADLPNIKAYTAEGALADARSHFRNGDYGYSAALYKRAVELSPKDKEGYIGLSASYDRLRRFDLADRVYASWHTMGGDSAQYYNNVGYSNMLRGNLTVALANFRKAKALDPANVVVANNLQLLADAAAQART